MPKFIEMDVLLADVPADWEGWPLARSLSAQDFGTLAEDLRLADRIELIIRRTDFPGEATHSLVGSMAALIERADKPLVMVEGIRMDDEYDLHGLYFAVPASTVFRVISRLEV